MKRMLPFLTALCLLATAVPASRASAVLSAVFERAAETSKLPGEKLQLESGAAQPAGFPVTAQQWIQGFHIAAAAQELTLENSFSHDSDMVTGQYWYDLTIAKTPAYVIGLLVLSEDDVAVSLCSMRMASAMLRPGELAEADDALWRAVRAMIAASEPQAKKEDIEELCAALCPDLPAALTRREQVEAVHTLGSISCTLWAGFVEDAYYTGDSPNPSDGYIVDFVIRADAPEEPG